MGALALGFKGDGTRHLIVGPVTLQKCGEGKLFPHADFGLGANAGTSINRKLHNALQTRKIVKWNEENTNSNVWMLIIRTVVSGCVTDGSM